MGLVDIISGKGLGHVPAAIYEAMFAAVFHWDLNRIRSLSVKDFQTFAPMVDMIFRRNMDKGL